MVQDPDGSIVISHHFVAFLDVLGQETRLSKISSLPDPASEEQKEKFIKLIRETHIFVKALRSGIRNYIGSFKSISHESKNRTSEEKRFLSNVRSTEVKIQSFSDTSIIFFSLMQNKGNVPVTDVWGSLVACSLMSILSMYAGHVLRGAIEVGLGAEMDRNEIYGPVLSTAYNLERKKAEYPRILIGNGLMRYISAMKEMKEQDHASRLSRQYAEKSLGMVTSDHDGHMILDYLGQGFKNSVPEGFMCEGLAVTDLVNAAHQFVRDELQKFKDQKNEKLEFRYNKLLNYFEGRIGLWKNG